jgi:hypothetical protein
MNNKFTYTIKRTRFDENYNPAENTRITTNFANLARGVNREENLRNTLIMMNNRFNSLAHWDNPHNDRYAVELDIISVEMNIAQDSASFPVIEILQTHIVDKKSGSVMPVSSAITSPPMCGITILAYCFWNIIRTRVASAYRKTLASCTAISLRILCNPAPGAPTSARRR